MPLKILRLAVMVSFVVGLVAPVHALASGLAPTANARVVDIQANAIAAAISLTGDDNEADDLTFTVDTLPSHGSLDTTTPAAACHGASGCDATVAYTPTNGYNGPDSFTFHTTDTTPTDSVSATVTITVNATPTFTVGADQNVAEDSGAHSIPTWISDQSAGPGEGSQVLTFVVTNNTNTGLFSGGGPTVSSAGTLTYTPAANVFGSATITLRLDDDHGGSSGTQQFIIAVSNVNDPPSFTKGADETVAESSGAHSVPGWATAISDGPNESGQVLTFVVTDNTNTALFSAGPAVSATTGALSYTLAASQNGVATISLRLDDNGGGTNSSGIQTFTITVTAVNTAPFFAKGPDETVLEDAGAQSFPTWATNISPGVNEAGQTVSLVVVATTTTLFSVQPAVSPTGTLSFTPAPNANGSTSVTIHALDSLGSVSPNQTFNITITAVNDAPTFTVGPTQTVAEDSGARSVPLWASSILPGGTGETAQTLTFGVTNNTNTGLFAVAPAVSPTGTLTFTPATNRNGTATITLVLTDSGDVLNGGINAAAPVLFTINVTAVNDPPNAVNDVGLSVTQNAGATAFAVLANDSILPDTSQTLTITAVTQGAHGTVAITGLGAGLTYAPAPGYRGSDSFTYTISDGALTDTATVLLGVVQAGTVTRVSGGDRYATSAAISKANFAPGVPVVYIASGLGFADALSGAPVAGIKHGPVLLVTTNAIPTTVAAELTRLKPVKIVILGGPSVVSSAVATALHSYTTGSVIRLAGADRYATSAVVSKANFATGVPVVYIASGLGFPDALSGAPVAAIKGGPILLVPGTSIPGVIATELTRLKPVRIVILGGTSVVSSGVATSLKAYATSGGVTRLSGADRYATSAAISKANFAAHVPIVYIATGLDFPNALAGAPVAAIHGGPILLVSTTAIPASIIAELIRLKPANIVLLGSATSVSDAVKTALGFYTTGP